MKASLVTYDNSLENRIFDKNKRDNNSRKFIYLKNKLQKHNISLETYDINPQEESIISIYFDVHKKALFRKRSKKNILVVRESPIINKYNNDQKYFNKFDLIMTWNRNLCDQKKIFWIGYGNSSELYENDLDKIYRLKKNTICSIISKKHSIDKSSLYKEREKAINFFMNKNIQIDLYGYGWDSRHFTGIFRPFNKILFARKFLYNPPVSYKGTVMSKSLIFSKYKFSLCFENCIYKSYITEKIFDSMFAGCIPIYLGCPNIKEEIDPNTFIDLRDFSSYQEVYSYLKSMTKNEYISKITKIIDFYKEYKNTTYYDLNWADSITSKCLSLINESYL